MEGVSSVRGEREAGEGTSVYSCYSVSEDRNELGNG